MQANYFGGATLYCYNCKSGSPSKCLTISKTLFNSLKNCQNRGSAIYVRRNINWVTIKQNVNMLVKKITPPMTMAKLMEMEEKY